MAGKVPITSHHVTKIPDKWILTIVCDSCNFCMKRTVSQYLYNQVKVGDTIILK